MRIYYQITKMQGKSGISEHSGKSKGLS